ncbi:MAG: hypothetical protein FWB72_02375 [Firmicutes bacterium]|nr:hypothetical protein [Bacillota bacterium]
MKKEFWIERRVDNTANKTSTSEKNTSLQKEIVSDIVTDIDALHNWNGNNSNALQSEYYLCYGDSDSGIIQFQVFITDSLEIAIERTKNSLGLKSVEITKMPPAKVSDSATKIANKPKAPKAQTKALQPKSYGNVLAIISICLSLAFLIVRLVYTYSAVTNDSDLGGIELALRVPSALALIQIIFYCALVLSVLSTTLNMCKSTNDSKGNTIKLSALSIIIALSVLLLVSVLHHIQINSILD